MKHEEINYNKIKRLLETLDNKINLAQQAVGEVNAQLTNQSAALNNAADALKALKEKVSAIASKVGV